MQPDSRSWYGHSADEPARREQNTARQTIVVSRDDQLTALLASVALGSREALADLYKHTSSMLFALALRILRDRAAAEEALQDCVVRIWHQASSYAPARGRPLTWMAAIVRYHCLDELRRRGTAAAAATSTTHEMAEEAFPSPLDAALEAADSRAVRDCLGTLDHDQRRAVTMAFFDGMTHAEVALAMGRPLGTVKSQIRRGLQWLRRCLATGGMSR